MDGLVLTVERMIRASPEAIFDVLADPSRHPSIDGSGMLQGAPGSPRLPSGGPPASVKLGIHYATVSTVVEFEKDRLIAWQTGPKGKLERFVAGRIRRYELCPPGRSAPWSGRAGTSRPTISEHC